MFVSVYMCAHVCVGVLRRVQLEGAKVRTELLNKNLSQLFATAKLEVDRKDEEIQRLRAVCV